MAIRDRVKELRRVRAGDLQENAANWRRHPKAQVDALAGVISEIGFAGALIAYEDDNGTLTLIDGHMRAGVSADQELPVVVLDVNEAEAKKLLATYDPIGAMAQTDTDALMSLLGDATFQAEPVNAMLEALANGEHSPLALLSEPTGTEGLTDPDDVPPEPAEPWVKRGDMFTLGEHRLLCGDATSTEDVKRLMDGERVAVIATSPPYLDAREYGLGDFDWDALMGGVFSCVLDHVAPLGDVLVNLGQIHRSRRVVFYWDEWLRRMETLGWPLFGLYVWDKGKALPGEWSGRLAPAHEFIFHFDRDGGSSANKWVETKIASKGAYTFRQKDGSLRAATSPDKIGQPFKIPDSVVRISPHVGADIGHPAMFPVAFAEFLAHTWSNDGDIVLDPFLGAGTTLIAAERLGRRCYSMDIEPKYAQVTIERWEAFTGKKATKV